MALRTWVECYASRGYANPWVAGLLTTDPRSLALDELLEAADLIGLSGLRRLLGEVCSRGELAPGVSPALAAWLLWAGAHSLLVLRDVVAEHDDGAVHGPRIRCLAAAVVGGIIAKASPSP